ncbi:Induced myeloid leukemia cell differentiation protein Mcl-1 like protein [Chelonia mydas]|uniref:Induced myeloid leukemia cell differentiation protein Mcl-1 like protein n=1 Tax=Chelonia mydas TaxID=8469 RepID=M7BI64_CHEMY|nr:Induced myeloid leukemia cell differentiation protein Mcl-1 like protein [Chelonia mydas]
MSITVPYNSTAYTGITVLDTQEKEAVIPEKAEEAKLKAKYPNLGQKPGGHLDLCKVGVEMPPAQNGRVLHPLRTGVRLAKVQGNGISGLMTPPGMLRKLDIKSEEDLKSVTAVATHVFNDGVTNWGRIVTLISFGAFVAKHLKSINQENCINTLAGIITDVLVTGKRDWLVNQRGWEGFVEFFRVEDLEGSIRNVLVAFAGFAGLGASLAYMMR